MDYHFPSAEADGHQPTALLIADDAAAALPIILESAGARLIASLGFAEGAERLRGIAGPDIVVLRCTAPHPHLPMVLEMIADRARVGGVSLVIGGLPVLDQLYDALADHAVDLLCDPQDHDVIAAVALAVRACAVGQRAEQARGKDSPVRLQRLSQEVARLSRQIDDLESRIGPPSATPSQFADRNGGYQAEGPAGEPASPSHFRNLLRARRQRDDFFPSDLFAEPCWDMMLDLMAARLAGQQVSVSSLCAAAAVPPTTALRWIRMLTERGVFIRSADPADGRRIFIALAKETADGLVRWHQSVRRLIQGAA